MINIFKIIKIIFTFLILIYLARKIEINDAISKLLLIDNYFNLIALVIILISLLLNSVKSYLIGRALNIKLTFKKTCSFIFIGHFFSQLLPTSFGGDSIRALLINRENKANSILKTISSILCDRITGLFILTVLPFCSLIIFHNKISINLIYFFKFALLLILITIFLNLVLFFFTRRISYFFRKVKFLNFFFNDLHKTIFKSNEKLFILFLSVAMQLLLCLSYVLIAKSINVSFSIYDALIIVPLINLITTIPISFGGWGLREGVSIIAMKFCAISSVEAFSISIIFGLLQILCSVPGLTLFLFKENFLKK